MKSNVYLDESGDLGWKFGAEYRRGGSSRYLTLAYIIVPRASKALPKRLVRECFRKWGADPKQELKGNRMSLEQQDLIIDQTIQMLHKEPNAHLGAITVKKQNVAPHIRQDGNKLYNYMIGLGLLSGIRKCDHVNLIRDNRSVKVKSGNSIGDYLQTKLWFEMCSCTELVDMPQDSLGNNSLQFIDWISYMVWSAYEDRNMYAFCRLQPYLSTKDLFFGR
ncbi:MAG: DUF3800 domain-containing protein [Bacteroidota bacterium]